MEFFKLCLVFLSYLLSSFTGLYEEENENQLRLLSLYSLE